MSVYLADEPGHGRTVLYPATHKPLCYHTVGHGYDVWGISIPRQETIYINVCNQTSQGKFLLLWQRQPAPCTVSHVIEVVQYLWLQ